MPHKYKGFTKHALFIVLLVACCTAFFLPALMAPDNVFVGVFLGKGDAEGTMWWNWTVKESILAGKWPTSTFSIYHPFGVELAPFYGSPLNSLPYIPFHALISLPLSNTIYCLLLLLADALIGYIYFYRHTKSPILSLFIASIWALPPMKFMEYADGHLPQIPFCFIPLVFLALERLNSRPGLRAGLLAGLFLICDSCGYYQHAFAVLFLFAFSFIWGLGSRITRKERVGQFFAGYIIAGLAVVGAAFFFYQPLISGAASMSPETGFVYPDKLPLHFHELRTLPGAPFLERTSLISVNFNNSVADHSTLLFCCFLVFLTLATAITRLKKTWPYLAAALFFGILVLGPFIRIRFGDPVASFSQLFVWRSSLYAFLYAWVPAFSRLYWPDTFWPYAHFAACAAIAVGMGSIWKSQNTQIKKATGVLYVCLACLMISLTILYVQNRPFLSKFNMSPVIESLRDAPGSAFLPIPSGPLDDYHLPAVVGSGKALVGGRGRDLGYLVPRKWAQFSQNNPTVASLERWTPMNASRSIDMDGIDELISLGVGRALLDKQALLKQFENPLLPQNSADDYEAMIEEVMSKFGRPIIEDRRFALFSLPRILFLKDTPKTKEPLILKAQEAP
jgi:hypothetical protein